MQTIKLDNIEHNKQNLKLDVLPLAFGPIKHIACSFILYGVFLYTYCTVCSSTYIVRCVPLHILHVPSYCTVCSSTHPVRCVPLHILYGVFLYTYCMFLHIVRCVPLKQVTGFSHHYRPHPKDGEGNVFSLSTPGGGTHIP